MGCAGCGSPNCGGCGTPDCNSSSVPSGCSNVNPCTDVSGCSSTASCATNPYYQSCSPCPENNCSEVIYNLFRAAVCLDNAWIVPACGSQAIVYSTDTKVLPVGAYLWHDTYGYFKVTGFNSQNGEITLLNECTPGNADPGTSVPSCTCFIVAPEPVDIPVPATPCVALEFVAPAVGSCVVILVTSVNGLSEGDVISLGSGEYRLQTIVSETQIEICNDGDGITPGTTVLAFNEAGEYQNCISVLEDCCTRLNEALLSIRFSNQTAVVTGNLIALNASLFTAPLASVFNNISASRTMRVFIQWTAVSSLLVGNISGNTVRYAIELSVNGGPYSLISNYDRYLIQSPGSAYVYGNEIIGTEVIDIAPLATLSLNARAYLQNTSGSGATLDADALFLKGRALAVAL